MSRPTASLSIAILGLFAVGASAQFSVDNFAGSAQDFFDAVFGAVSGVVVTSASFTGDSASFGNFSMGLSTIGLESGVILSSGTASDIDNGSGFLAEISTDFNGPGDPDLVGISTSGTSGDASVFVVEFEATEPVVFSIEFVFASDEYNAFLNFEDPFGFFVDGVNIALTPDGLPITVSNINCGFSGTDLSGPNCDLFVNNELDPPPFDIAFNGFTVVLTATSEVLDVGPHTLKFAISDEGDGVVDTAVLIGGNAELVTATPTASVKSDPHIQGFRGQEFDFQGQPGSIYAFLSCPGLELNVLLEDAYTSGFSVQKDALGNDGEGDYTLLSYQKKGTWATQAGFLFQSPEDDTIHTVAIFAQPSEASNPDRVKFGSIIVDQESEITTLGEYEVAPGIGLYISNSKTFTRINVTCEALNFKAIVDVVSPPFNKGEAGKAADNDFAKLWHINIQIVSLDGGVDAHGVVGQTVKPMKSGVEGEEDDYVVRDGLLGHDFTYDKFFSAATSHRQLKQVAESNGDKFKVDRTELDVLKALGQSPDLLLKLSPNDFEFIFHTNTEASRASLSADGLIQAMNRLATGETTLMEETKSIQMAMCLEQNTNGTGDMHEQESMKNRECLLRVNALLASGASE